MNIKQKTVLLIGIIALVLIALFPPWYGKKIEKSPNYETLGYGFIFSKMHYEVKKPTAAPYYLGGKGKLYTYDILKEPYWIQRIDVPRFALPFLSTGLLMGGLLIFFKSKPSGH